MRSICTFYQVAGLLKPATLQKLQSVTNVFPAVFSKNFGTSISQNTAA